MEKRRTTNGKGEGGSGGEDDESPTQGQKVGDKTHWRGKYLNATPASHRINALCNFYPKRRNFF